MESNEYLTALWEEIRGCVKYTGLSLDEVMSMPVHLRKNWIEMHNAAESEAARQQKEQEKKNDNVHSLEGSAINSYAALEQKRNGN